MRKIEQQIVNAIRAGKPFKGGNTEVRVNDALVPGGIKPLAVLLYGHMVAHRDNAGTVTLDWCGYNTPKTQSRLSAVCDALDLPVYARIRNFGSGFAMRNPNGGEDGFVANRVWVSEPGVGQ